MKVDKKSEGTKKLYIDIGSIKATFKTANEFITKLWKISPIPTTETEGDEDNEENGQAPTTIKPIRAKFAKSYGTGKRAQSLEELHNKLEELKGKRASYKDSLQKKGLKNRISKKAKKEERALKKKLVKTQKQKANAEMKIKTEEVKFKPTKPIYNSEGKMVFSKFDFSESSATTDEPEKRTLDPKALMLRLEKQNEKMKKLEMSGDVEKVKLAKENFAWKTALEKSEGTKLKDDIALLAKTIKKNTIRKKHSKQKWEARDELVKKKKDTLIKKRTENIEKRQRQNKLNKLRKSSKKGRVIPGF